MDGRDASVTAHPRRLLVETPTVELGTFVRRTRPATRAFRLVFAPRPSRGRSRANDGSFLDRVDLARFRPPVLGAARRSRSNRSTKRLQTFEVSDEIRHVASSEIRGLPVVVAAARTEAVRQCRRTEIGRASCRERV